jgi:hypothetical protein
MANVFKSDTHGCKHDLHFGQEVQLISRALYVQAIQAVFELSQRPLASHLRTNPMRSWCVRVNIHQFYRVLKANMCHHGFGERLVNTHVHTQKHTGVHVHPRTHAYYKATF